MAYVTLTKAAQDLGVSVSTVRRYADLGELESIRLPSGHRRVDDSYLLIPHVRERVGPNVTILRPMGAA